MSISRRQLLSLGVVAAGSHVVPSSWAQSTPVPKKGLSDLAGLSFIKTDADGPYRGIARSLKGDDLIKARLTAETWQIEITGDEIAIEKPRLFKDKTAFDYASLVAMGKKHSVKVLKAMQCSAGISNHVVWEGVPLREVIKSLGKIGEFKRINISGYHDATNPKSHFHSVSASYAHVMENDPADPPIIVAYKLNGEPISQDRGGPVRVIVPWAYGFRSVKSLQSLVLTTNDVPVNTYYKGTPDTNYTMTIAQISQPLEFKSTDPITVRGMVVCGLEGLKAVEYWIRPDTGPEGRIKDGDPAWKTATWLPCELQPAPLDWTPHLPKGISSKEIWGFDPETGKPKEWPIRYSVAMWSATIKDLKAGSYELRVRAVDKSGRPQPELPPKRDRAKNQNAIQMKILKVT